MFRRVLALILVLGGVVSPALAAEQVLRLDPDATMVTFSLGSTLHTVHGELVLEEGVIVFDDETGKASGRVIIDATSAKTGNQKRDKKMHNKVLDSGTFPEIVFSPKNIEGRLVVSGSGPIILSGTVTLHGEKHPISIHAEVAWQSNQLTAIFEVPVPFVEWGLQDPSVFLLRTDKTVVVEVTARGTLEEAP
jgi:polyisoprenoid-binding protein YceI